MNLWDSVHRGLEKASQEAARMARAQRLRATMDGITRQVNVLHNNLISRTMDLYIAGQLTQSELLPICQELASLQQQIQQIQNELRQLQAAQTQAQIQGPGTGITPESGGIAAYPPTDEGAASYAPPPPDYQAYADAGPITAPPPPGAESLAMSSMETVIAPPPPGMAPVQPPVPAPAGSPRFCPSCQAELFPGHAFCQNCGTLVQNDAALHMPTVRSGAGTPFGAGEQETIRGNIAEGAPGTSDQETLRASAAPPPSAANPGENKGV